MEHSTQKLLSNGLTYSAECLFGLHFAKFYPLKKKMKKAKIIFFGRSYNIVTVDSLSNSNISIMKTNSKSLNI